MALPAPNISNVNGTQADAFRIGGPTPFSANGLLLDNVSSAGTLQLFKSDGSTRAKLQVATPTVNEDAATKQYVDSAAGTTSCEQVLSMTLAFGTAGTQTSTFLLPTGTQVTKVQVVVATPFNGTAPTVTVGFTAALTAFMTTPDNNLKVAGSYTKEQYATMSAGSPSGVILTYVADTSSAGAATVLVWFVQAPKSGQA